MAELFDCPDMQCRQALLDDAVSTEMQGQWERHVESCQACQEYFDQTDRCDEEFLVRAKRNGDPTATTADPVLTGVLERLHNGLEFERSTPPEPADLYFLRPSSRPGLLGTLGEYEVGEVIGQGGMGVVLKAFDAELNRIVAIKVLAAAVAGSAVARRRFKREAQAAAAVCHDHVVAVHGVGETDGLPFLVMQYVDGESLQHRLDRCGPLPAEETARIGLQSAMGLAALHAQGLVHRDIKPANLLLAILRRPPSVDTDPPRQETQCTKVDGDGDRQYQVKISDFGLARMIDDIGLTQAGVVAGTPEYMAPEQARGEPVDHRADLFSLGSALYVCCTGQPPFQGKSAVAVLRRVSDEAPATIRSCNPAVPTWLEALIDRLMAKAPAERFQSAAEVATLLGGFLTHLRQPAAFPAPPLPAASHPGSASTVPPRRFVPRGWLLVLALIAVAGFGISAVLLRPLLFQGTPAGVELVQAAAGPPNGGEAAPKMVFHQDFRTADLDPQLLAPLNDGVEWDHQGLRLKLEAAPDSRENTGFDTTFPVEGDFDITVSYSILSAGRPTKGYGIGVGLYAPLGSTNEGSISLARRLMPDGLAQFVSDHMTPAGGKVNHKLKKMRSTSTAGKLRLQRVGRVLQYLVADGADSPFVKLEELEVGDLELRLVRVETHRGGSDAGIDARLFDFSVQATDLPGVPRAGSDAGASARPAAGTWKALRSWPTVAGIVGLLIGLAVFGVWLSKRRKGLVDNTRPKPAMADKPALTAPLIEFECTGCRHNLKAKPELAGKKAKCHKCGGIVLVPRISEPQLPSPKTAGNQFREDENGATDG